MGYQELYAKMIEVQSELKAPKSCWNSFGKYSYRNAEDIIEAVKPLLAERGLLMTITDEIAQLGERYYVKATVTVLDGEFSVSTDGYAREAESKKGADSMQLTGMASSYARKYALNGMFAIDDGKDADSDGQQPQQQKYHAPVNMAKATQPTPKQLAWDAILRFSASTGIDQNEIVADVKARADYADSDEFWMSICNEFRETD